MSAPLGHIHRMPQNLPHNPQPTHTRRLPPPLMLINIMPDPQRPRVMNGPQPDRQRPHSHLPLIEVPLHPAAAGAEVSAIEPPVPVTRTLIEGGVAVDEAEIARAGEAEVDAARVVEDGVAFPGFAGTDFTDPEVWAEARCPN
jgi:hypothetical protein